MATLIPKISRAVARKLGYYVYLYVNPLDDCVFYIGKGKGGRALTHLRADERRRITKTIQKIRAAGKEPQIEILAHGLPSAEAALRVEAAAIDLLGLGKLANVVRGHGTRFGRMPLDQVVSRYTKHQARIKVKAILIRINEAYRYGMSDVELYDATRSAWKVGRRREGAKYAIAVYQGVVREVYEITDWLKDGSTFNVLKSGIRKKRPDSQRWEFVGTLADDQIRKQYLNKYVGDYFKSGAQNPISYVNVDGKNQSRGGKRR